MTPNNARFAKFVGYPMLGLTLLAFAHAATTPDKPRAAPIVPAKQLAAMVGGVKADYIIIAKDKEAFVLGCAILNEDALSTGKATGRIFDPSDSDHCRGIAVGTAVLSQKRFRNAVCVLPEEASPACVWVLDDELKPVQATAVPAAATTRPVARPAPAARETDEQRTARAVATWIAYDNECARLPDQVKADIGDVIGTISRPAMKAATDEVVRRVAVEGNARFCAALRFGF
jgi:hypothetical protein